MLINAGEFDVLPNNGNAYIIIVIISIYIKIHICKSQ